MLLAKLTDLSSILWRRGISYRDLGKVPGWPRVVAIREAITQGSEEVAAQNRERRKASAKPKSQSP